MPSDRHFINGVEHIVATNPSTSDAPEMKPLVKGKTVAEKRKKI